MNSAVLINLWICYIALQLIIWIWCQTKHMSLLQIQRWRLKFYFLHLNPTLSSCFVGGKLYVCFSLSINFVDYVWWNIYHKDRPASNNVLFIIKVTYYKSPMIKSLIVQLIFIGSLQRLIWKPFPVVRFQICPIFPGCKSFFLI